MAVAVGMLTAVVPLVIASHAFSPAGGTGFAPISSTGATGVEAQPPDHQIFALEGAIEAVASDATGHYVTVNGVSVKAPSAVTVVDAGGATSSVPIADFVAGPPSPVGTDAALEGAVVVERPTGGAPRLVFQAATMTVEQPHMILIGFVTANHADGSGTWVNGVRVVLNAGASVADPLGAVAPLAEVPEGSLAELEGTYSGGVFTIFAGVVELPPGAAEPPGTTPPPDAVEITRAEGKSDGANSELKVQGAVSPVAGQTVSVYANTCVGTPLGTVASDGTGRWNFERKPLGQALPAAVCALASTGATATASL